MLATEPDASLCQDCGRVRHGAYCSHCGQRHGRHDLSLRHVASELLDDFTHWDARVFKTLRLLILRPGQLTLEFLSGRRTRYVPPLRLYIFVSFLLFLALGLTPSTVKVVGHTHVSLSGEAAEAPPAPAGGSQEHALEAKAKEVAEHPEVFREHLWHWMSHVMFALLPAFAGLLALLFRRPRRYFVEHVIFALHFHSFAFLVFLASNLLGLLRWKAAGSAGGILVLGLPPYLGAAMKRVYGGPVWKIVLKGALLTAVYLVLVAAAMAGVAVWLLRG